MTAAQSGHFERPKIPAWWPDNGGESPDEWDPVTQVDDLDADDLDAPITYPHEITPTPYEPEF